MKHYLLPCLIWFSLVFPSCQNPTPEEAPLQEGMTTDTLALIQEIERMVQIDQAVQMAHLPGESAQRRDSLYQAQDSIFQSHGTVLRQILQTHGFPDFDLVGEEASQKYWLLVQHCDHDPEFQREVLKAMKPLLAKERVNAQNYAYLIDRVAKNAGEPLIYGTQLQYANDFWASPLPTLDSLNLDERRAEVGLPPIKQYLNEVMQMHYEMNQAIYIERGVEGPLQY